MLLSFPTLSVVSGNTFTGGGRCSPIKTAAGNYYSIYINNTSDVVYQKSTDGGLTWGNAVTVFTGTAIAIAACYDKDCAHSGDLIHLAYTDSDSDDTLYRSIDTASSDDLGTQTTIFAGGTTAGGGALSIVRARGGNLYCKTTIDAGAEGGFFRSVDTGANWTSRTNSEALATTDQWILLPGWNGGDTNDIMMFFWDASADEISRYLYDDSGDSWAESSIATTMLDPLAASSHPHFAAAVDTTNSRNLLVAWSALDTAGADLRCWHVTESAITEVTAVVTDSTDDQGLCAIGIDTDTEDWYVFYFGASGGTDTWPSSISLYYKKSTDDGATWGSETLVTPRQVTVNALNMTQRFDTRKLATFIGNVSAVIAAFDEPAAAAAGLATPMFGGMAVT